MEKFKIITEYLPQRCEICHNSDLFERETGHCSRCAAYTVGSKSAIAKPAQTVQPVQRVDPRDSSRVRLSPPVPDARNLARTLRPRLKRLIDSPADVTVEIDSASLRLYLNSFYTLPEVIFFSVVASIGLTPLLFLYLIINSSSPIIIDSFFIPWVVSSIVISLLVLIFGNRKFIEISNKEFKVCRCFRQKGRLTTVLEQIPAQEITQVFCSEKETEVTVRGRYGTVSKYKVLTHSLNIVTKDGKVTKVLDLPSSQENLAGLRKCLFLEQEIENYLGITDRPVYDEVKLPSDYK